VRACLKVSIAVLGLALLCAAIAPVATAAEAPAESEGVYLELKPRKDARVTIEVDLQRGVAVVDTEMGPLYEARRHRPGGAVDYAAKIPKGPTGDRLDLKIPGVLSVDGELTPSPDEEGVEFNGSLRFTGKGGYLDFHATHAIGYIGELRICEGGCPRPNASLFEYTDDHYPFVFSNENSQVLSSELRLPGRTGVFQATHGKESSAAAFKARGVEWAGAVGEVAVTRTIEMAPVAGSDFKVSSKIERPEWATVRPPAPFFGRATYRKIGTVRTPASSRLTGSLSADIFGVKVRLAGAAATASLVNLNPGL
jgi:hypothetical protein